MKRIMLFLLFLLVLLLPIDVGAQEVPRQTPPERGMVLDQDEWRAPTPVTALRELQNGVASDVVGMLNSREAAVAVLRQTFDNRPTMALDAFARNLVTLIREGPEHQAHAAHMVLLEAGAVYDDDGDDDRGVPYPGAADVFIGLYESYADRVSTEAEKALYGVFHTGGAQYVRDLFEASEQPPECQYPSQSDRLEGQRVEDIKNPCPNRSTWCTAGGLLVRNGEGPDPATWERLCVRKRF